VVHPEGWEVVRRAGSAAAFHGRALDDPLRRAVHVFEVERPALVLGSAQPDDVVDRAACEAAGVEVVRRRSGGGAVLVEPRGVVWVDVEVPRGDPLWHDDVGHATWWLGECWAEALHDLGITAALTVHRGGLVRTEWSDLVCFAGLGPGEVTDATGAKLLGIAQRRTRAGARMQCAVPLRWDSAAMANLLVAEPGLAEDLADAVTPVASTPAEVVDAFLGALPGA
jgi:lipoate-protein ligase A